MTTIEILAPEIIIVLFLALPLSRPFVKILWPLDGLVWLPFIALCIVIGIFPAYGFRPECLPILVFAVIYNVANLFPLIASMVSRPDDSFRDQRPLSIVCLFILLGTAAIPMFAFSSRVYEKSEADIESVKELKIGNRVVKSEKSFYRNYVLRVYGPVHGNRPLIFLVPPEIGAVASVDIVCTELQRQGFTVVTYSFKDNDLFSRRFTLSPGLLTYLRIYRKAASSASVNKQGKVLEDERRTEIEFLLPQLPALLGINNDKLPPFLLVGYGAGGSALAYLAGETDFVTRSNNVLGIVAIESRLWSSYLPETPYSFKVPPGGGMIMRQWVNIENRLMNILPQKVIRKGPLPGAGLSAQSFPVLYLISGRALNYKGRKPYQAVFDCIYSGLTQLSIIAVEGAGPLDYQDFPFTHPIYSFLLPGMKGAEKNENPIGDTIGIIRNFASFLLEKSEQAERTDVNMPSSHPISGSYYIDGKGLSNFRP